MRPPRTASANDEPSRFAATKIQPARARAERVQRPALDATLLDAVQNHRVVLLQAPAGYGKTSALASLAAAWARAHPGAALAWVSLDADDDAARLMACLAAALEPFDLPWRTLPEALVSQMHQGVAAARRAVEELLNALAHADVPQGVIVLEDLHRVRNPDLAGLGDLLIERLPAHWCLVLTTREAPKLALARLRARGELAEFGPETLRFSVEESERFVSIAGLPGSAGASMHERTHGWPAGLRLDVLAHQSRPGLAAHSLGDRYVFEYLASEVLDALPRELHDFLLRCSVLPELTAARAAAVSGDRHAAERLDEIEQRALFATPLDAAERTLVLHDLFRDALSTRLAQRLGDERPTLLRRAAASETDPLRRVGYLLQAGDWAAAEQLLDEAAPELFLRTGPGDVERALAQFEPAWTQTSVVLAQLAAVAALLRWDWDSVAALAARVDALPVPTAADGGARVVAWQRLQALNAMALYVLNRNDASQALIERLHSLPLAPTARRMLLMADATQHFRRGKPEQVLRLYRELTDSLVGEPSLFEWWQCVPAANWTTLPGMRQEIERFVDGALLRLGAQPLALRADLSMLRAYNHLWSGRIEAAQADARAAEDDMRWLACSGETDITVQIFRLIESGICGQAEQARQRLHNLLARNTDATPERRRLWLHHMAVYGLRISHLLDEGPQVLERWAMSLQEDPLRSAQHDNHRALSTRLRHAVASGQWERAAEQFRLLLPRLPNMDVNAHTVELQLRGAHILLQTGDRAGAAHALLPALQRMQAEGTPGYALMAGPKVLRAVYADFSSAPGGVPADLLELLRGIVELAEGLRAGMPAAAAASGSAAGQATSAPPGAAAGRPPSMDHALSTREAEVLDLLARGQSNKLIARELDISPHTVKRHVANILDKLALESRGQAAAWWLKR